MNKEPLNSLSMTTISIGADALIEMLMGMKTRVYKWITLKLELLLQFLPSLGHSLKEINLIPSSN